MNKKIKTLDDVIEYLKKEIKDFDDFSWDLYMMKSQADRIFMDDIEIMAICATKIKKYLENLVEFLENQREG